jgi:Flp pilus assembly protein TadG
MIKQGRDRSGQEGFALLYMAGAVTFFLLITGLAVDSGRAYVVKAQLSKAVDGAALGAARNLNTGDPRGEAARIYRANFPAGYFGTTSSTDPIADAGFFSSSVVPATGVNVVRVTASAVLPTTFMRLGNFTQVTVTSTGEAQRRMVDLSLVLDVSGSIGPQWGAVRDAARAFVKAFDQTQDRLALLTFSDTGKVIDAMPAGRGFDKPKLVADIPNTLPGGSTAMVEGLYRGWDELRSVPLGSQSGLRVIVLFTDGASNSVPAFWDSGTVAKGLRTYDFPDDPGDTNNQTWDRPQINGVFDTLTGNSGPSMGKAIPWDDHSLPPTGTFAAMPASGGFPAYLATPTWAYWMPNASAHTHHRSSGIPTSFPLVSNTLKVEGIPQITARPMRDKVGTQFPAQVHNINNAARNLVEIIANEARNDVGDYRIRIFTIGMGQLVRLKLGTKKETSESILKRIANDSTSFDYNPDQLEGQYYYAETAAHVGPAFQALQNQIVRLSK